MEIVRKSKISWVISKNSVVAFDKLQATTYNAYGMPTRQPLSLMKKRVRKSKANELNSWLEVIELASEQGVIGYGTRIKPEWLNES